MLSSIDAGIPFDTVSQAFYRLVERLPNLFPTRNHCQSLIRRGYPNYAYTPRKDQSPTEH